MSYTNSKAEKLAFVPKLLECITSGDESKLDECFAQDFKMLVPGTNGRESNEIPLPPGIAGMIHFLTIQVLIFRAEDVYCCNTQGIQRH